MARLIDGDALIAWIKGSQQMTSKMKNIICYIKTVPTIDAVEVVRCKDCNYSRDSFGVLMCDKNRYSVCVKPDGFCSYGERKDHE